MIIHTKNIRLNFIHEILIRLTRPAIQSFEIFNNGICNLVYAIIILLISLLIVLLIKKVPLLKKIV